MNDLPYGWLRKHESRVLAGLFLATILLALAMRVLDAPLTTAEAPNGIVSFELAGTPAAADRIISSWDEYAQRSAGVSIGLDFLFLIAYSSFLALLSLVTGRKAARSYGLFQITTLILTAGCFIAGLLDTIENIALIQVLFGNPSATWPSVARVAALAKFGLLGLAVIGIITQVVAGRITQSR